MACRKTSTKIQGQGNSNILAVDPSLTASGWALFSISDKKPIKAGIIRSLPPCFDLEHRYVDLQKKITTLIKTELCIEDLLICEGPAHLVQNPHTSIKVERVRGLFEAIARNQKIRVLERVNPRSAQVQILGLRGRQIKRNEVKKQARKIVETTFKDSILFNNNDKKLPQDIIDAIIIGWYATSYFKINEFSSRRKGGHGQEKRTKNSRWQKEQWKKFTDKKSTNNSSFI